MIASLEIGKGRWFGFLIDLNWCRFTKDGWYESGGRFIQTVLSPMERDGLGATAGLSSSVPALLDKPAVAPARMI